MIYLDQPSWDEIHHLLKEQKQRLERLRRIFERQKAGGQISTPATIKIRPKKIVKTAEKEQRPPIFVVEIENMVGQEEIPRPPVVSVETEIMVGLEEKVQISESQINLENDSTEVCPFDEQDQFMVSAEQTTPIDMIIGDTVDMEKSRSAKLFKLKAEIGEIIMPGGHNNCSTHSAADKKYFAKSNIFGDHFLFGSMQNLIGCVDIQKSQLGIKHRWPPPLYSSATFVFFC